MCVCGCAWGYVGVDACMCAFVGVSGSIWMGNVHCRSPLEMLACLWVFARAFAAP